jgi:NADH dehydrogenase/NADH:ubiquinone oxidoreductase subunit G
MNNVALPQNQILPYLASFERFTMVHLTIDGKPIEVSEGTSVLRAAEQAGIEIPKLCDHPALKPFGSCRVCLVEVQGMRTLQPSCTLPVSPNMVVQTSTPAVKEARKFVLALIFSERNHFCPYCQMTGGDCELQNTALDQGMTHWPIAPAWKAFPIDASNPNIFLDHNRCILCRRCVRVCGDLVGMSTLGFEERGSQSMLAADMGLPLGQSSCISCGSCAQVCPTGTLTDRNSAYQGRDSTATPVDSICTQCGLGCGITLQVRDNRIMRVDGNWQAEVNGGIICKAGRFDAQKDKRDRVVRPMVRKNGKLVETSWEEALSVAAKGLKAAPAQVIMSSHLSAEALYAGQQIAVALKAQTGALPEREIAPIPPFLGENIGANLNVDEGLLVKMPPTEATWAEPYAVRAGANHRSLQALSIQGMPVLTGSVLVAAADDDGNVDLSNASFVIALAGYISPLTERADVVLPAAIWSEQEGHYLNLTGRLQKTARAIQPIATVWTCENALTALANDLGVALQGSWETALKVTA